MSHFSLKTGAFWANENFSAVMMFGSDQQKMFSVDFCGAATRTDVRASIHTYIYIYCVYIYIYIVCIYILCIYILCIYIII